MTRASMEKSFVCTTRGSKPAPNIEWFINSQLVDSTLTQVRNYSGLNTDIIIIIFFFFTFLSKIWSESHKFLRPFSSVTRQYTTLLSSHCFFYVLRLSFLRLIRQLPYYFIILCLSLRLTWPYPDNHLWPYTR